MIRISTATFVVLFACSASALAQINTLDSPHPVLKAEATVTGDVVRVGDVVAHAGIIAKVPIFRAPDLGFTGTVSADDVAEAVRAHALIGLDTAGITEVKVTRAARAIPVKELEDAVAHALSVHYNLGSPKNIAVTFDRDMRAMYVEPSALGEPRVSRVDYDNRSGRFAATLEIPTGTATRGNLRLYGRALATVDVVTVSRQIDRGAVVKASDVLIERRPRAEVGRDAITNRDQAIGLAARATLQPGRPLHNAELMKPDLVQRHETVTLVYQAPGMTLTVRGQASEGGAQGDTIAVINEQTKHMVQGVVVGPGRVLITASSPRLAANITPAGQ